MTDKHAEVKQEHRDWVHNAFPSYVIWPHSGVGAYGIHGLTGMCGDGFHTNECNVKAQLLADYSAEVERKARLDKARCADTHDYDAVPHRTVNPVGLCSQCRRSGGQDSSCKQRHKVNDREEALAAVGAELYQCLCDYMRLASDAELTQFGYYARAKDARECWLALPAGFDVPRNKGAALPLARAQARRDEAKFIRSPEEAKARIAELDKEIERLESEYFGAPAAGSDVPLSRKEAGRND